MLVKTMLDYTPPQSPDFAPLQRALKNISHTANLINDNVAKFAELTILQRLGTCAEGGKRLSGQVRLLSEQIQLRVRVVPATSLRPGTRGRPCDGFSSFRRVV